MRGVHILSAALAGLTVRASGAVRTMHGDMCSAWDPGMLAFHVARCLKADVDCGSQ